MSIFQTQDVAAGSLYGGSAGFDPRLLLGILRRKLLYFAVPYLVVLLAGVVVIALQRPIYRSEGKILVESPEIPPDLVRPTITEVAYERVQVIQQRIMARDNLMSLVNRFSLFPREREAMSSTELLDLIRSRTVIKPVELSGQSTSRQGNPTIAFTLSFDYEDATTAMKVANEFLTSILREDASARNKDAAGTTQFLEREVKRIEAEHDAVVAQIVASQKRPLRSQSAVRSADKTLSEPEELRQQRHNLVTLEAELAAKSSVYSDEHPVLKQLRSNIASIKQMIASAPKTANQPAETLPESDNRSLRAALNDGEPRIDADILLLTRQEANLQKSLQEAHAKLTAARLGETMERNQQGERLQVIEQPSLPQKSIRPKKLVWLAGAFVLALFSGLGVVFLSESTDDTIRSSRDLAKIVERRLLISIPPLRSAVEDRRERRRVIMVAAGVLFISLCSAASIAVGSLSLAFNNLTPPVG